MIRYISVDKIYPHPDNPRKDLGDLTELTQSIKVKGILQNLTVVPGKLDDHYVAVIGHRRLAAAKFAGLKEVPCVVSDMDQKEQVATMLLENMQRSDLTVYEQAQGFQLMLDFGETVNEIAEQTGFSETTVRRRVKLLELDQDKFKASPERMALAAAYCEFADSRHDGYFRAPWREWPRYEENEELDYLYDTLESFGYKISDEEQALRDGTHELFTEVKE